MESSNSYGINEANKCVREREISMRLAAKKFDVNYATLRNRLNGQHNKKTGGQSKFTLEEETHFADLLLSCAELGVPLSKVLLRKVIFHYYQKNGFSQEKSVVTDKWHRAFLCRLPTISVRISRPENRKKAADWTPELCDQWIHKLYALQEDGFLDDPAGLWNLDESSFALAELWQRVYAANGVKFVAAFFDGNPREQLTVLAGGNAAGKMLRPFIQYDEKVQLSSRFEGTNDKCLLGLNASGWMDNPNFTAYVNTELINTLTAMTAEKNVIFVDGHSSHINNLEFLLSCRDSPKNIKVVCFPSGQTSRLQPLDRSVVGGMNYNRRKHLRGMQSGCFNGLPPTTRNSFPQHLIRLFEICNLAPTLQSGFRQTGLYPFDESMIRSTIVSNAVSTRECLMRRWNHPVDVLSKHYWMLTLRWSK